METITQWITSINDVLWTYILVIMLLGCAVWFTIKTRFVQFRMFKEMVRLLGDSTSKAEGKEHHISSFQAFAVSLASRVGTGNLAGVATAITVGGPGAVFWMWLIAIFASSTAFIEATLAQIYKTKDPLYGGYRGGPAYYIHALFTRKDPGRKRSVIAVLFALSGLLCWAGVSQVIGNSVSSAFDSAFGIPPLYSTIALVAISAVIVLRKKATVKVLDNISLHPHQIKFRTEHQNLLFYIHAKAIVLFQAA